MNSTNNKGLFKYQQGGGFVSYNPLVDTEKKARKAAALRREKQEGKEALAEIKNAPKLGLDPDIYKKLADNGITSDVNVLERDTSEKMTELQNMSNFEKGTYRGKKLIQELTSGMVSKLNNIKRSSTMFEESRKMADKNNSYTDDAMTSDGRLLIRNEDGSVGALTMNQLSNARENGLNIRTIPVSEAIRLREMEMPGADFLIDAIQSTAGSEQVTDYLNKQFESLGSTEIKGTGKTMAQILGTDPNMKEISSKSNTSQIKAALSRLSKEIKGSFKDKLQKDAIMRGTTVDSLLLDYANAKIEKSDSQTDYSVAEKKAMLGDKTVGIKAHQAADQMVNHGDNRFSIGENLVLNLFGGSMSASNTMGAGEKNAMLSTTKFSKMTTTGDAVLFNGNKIDMGAAMIQSGSKMQFVHNFPVDEKGNPEPKRYEAMQKDKEKIKEMEVKRGKPYTDDERRALYRQLGYGMDENKNPIPLRTGSVMVAKVIVDNDRADLDKGEYSKASDVQKEEYNSYEDIPGVRSISPGTWFGSSPVETAIFVSYNPSSARFADDLTQKIHAAYGNVDIENEKILNRNRAAMLRGVDQKIQKEKSANNGVITWD